MLKYKKKFLGVLLCASQLVSCGNSPAPTKFTPLAQGTTAESIEDTLGEEPTEIKEENGSTCYLYENSKYKDYAGTMTYYCAEDQVMICRWEYDVKDLDERHETYFDILSSLEEEYGAFTKGDNDVTYTLQSDDQNITLESFSQGSGFNIVITYIS